MWMRAHSRMPYAAFTLFGLLIGAASFPGVAQESLRASTRVKFDLAPQSLAEALQAYSVATGIQIMYESSTTAKYRIARVEGELTADAALEAILADTGLRVRHTSAYAITIAPAAVPTFDAPPSALFSNADITLDTLRVREPIVLPDQGRLGEYVGAIQGDVQRALKRKAGVASGSYSIGVKLWVDPGRTVQRTELFRSTGDPKRDTEIVAVLQGLLLSQSAPANTPQPVRVLINIRSL